MPCLVCPRRPAGESRLASTATGPAAVGPVRAPGGDAGRASGAVRAVAALGLVLAALLAGCASSGGPAPAGYYRVKSGDTLSEIAERRGVSMRKLAAWNGLRPPYVIYAGGLLRVRPPGGSLASVSSRPPATVSARGARPPARSASAPASTPAPAAVKTRARAPVAAGSVGGTGVGASSGITWQWPASGPLKQRYQAGDRSRQGIRIALAEGSAVHAASDGTVVYGGSGLKGYGNLIIVRHSDRYLSAYGFNRRLLASEGDRVRRGQPVAESGRSADGQPLLHFEIRRDGAAVDPLQYLPAR